MNSKEMNNFICSFINSKDIRNHLIKTNYCFSTTEAAWLIYQCKTATLEEKITAWKKIIEIMPDESVDSPHFKKPYESIHKVILDFIKMKEETYNMFCTETPTSFYRYTLVDEVGNKDYEYSILYKQFKTCFKQLTKELLEESQDFTGEIIWAEIGCTYTITAYYNRYSQLMDVSIPASYCVFPPALLNFFNSLWFHFPTPFKKGDILYDPYSRSTNFCSGPVVITDITPLLFDDDGIKHADTTDMNVWGYFQDDQTGTIYYEVTDNYMDYEYYPEDMLTGKKRILKALSNFVKGKIDLELLIRAYHCIILEERKNGLMPRNYTQEGLELAGLSEL